MVRVKTVEMIRTVEDLVINCNISVLLLLSINTPIQLARLVVLSMNPGSLFGVFSNVQPKQIDVAHMPIVALQSLAERNLWLVHLKNPALDVSYNGGWIGKPHLLQHHALVVSDCIGSFECPSDRVRAYRGLSVRLQPAREIALPVGHPRTNATGLVGIGAVGQRFEIGGVEIKPGRIRDHQLFL